MSSDSKLSRSKEKVQVKWGVEAFSRFLTFAEKRGTLPPSQVATLKSELSELEGSVMGEGQPEIVTEQLNNYIASVNGIMKKSIDPKKYAPFPAFSFAEGAYLQSAVLDQIDMIERVLTEAAESGILEWNTEGQYFREVLKIFTQVESGKMRPQEGMAKLVGELNKINQGLSEDWKLPLPDLSAYE